MNTKTKNIKQVLIYSFVILFSMLVLCRANIVGKIKPFGFGLGFSLVFCNVYPIFSIIFMFFGLILQNLTMQGLISVASTSAVLILYYIISRVSKNKKLYLLMIFCFLSRISNVYFMSGGTIAQFLWSLADIVIGTTYCYIYCKIIQVIQIRGVQAFSKAEKILLHLVVFAVCCGLTNVVCFNIDFSKFVFLLLILFASVCFKQKAVSFVLAGMVSMFASTLTGQNIVLYLLAMSIVLAGISQNKFVQAGIVCIIDSLIIYLSGTYYLNIIPTIMAILLFVIVPSGWCKKISEFVLGTKKNIISNYIAECRQNSIKNKLLTMSIMFDEMQQCYKDMILSESGEQGAKEFLANEIKNKMCSNCINKLNCYNNKDMTNAICELLDISIKKGSANLIDVPNLLASNCNRMSGMMLATNAMAEQYLSNQKKIQQDAENKLGISLQYSGTSTIFRELSAQFIENYVVNAKKSSAIKNCLTESGIVCKECIALENYRGVAQIVMALRSVDCVRHEILSACKKIYNLDFEKQDCKITRYAGWSIVSVVPKEKYELLCGIATAPKTDGTENGDNYVFTKLDNGKYIFAIADGMGHGKMANKLSQTSIGLIESFYKCGFDNQLVVDSLNNLLLPINDGYATLDASIIDTFSGKVDFVKLGSSISVVKQHDEIYSIGVESLPLGAVEISNPTFTTMRLFADDVVVMASDGVVDAFGQENFCNYINNENIINMQFFADEILQEAIARQQKHYDDMTVITYKISQKR